MLQYNISGIAPSEVFILPSAQWRIGWHRYRSICPFQGRLARAAPPSELPVEQPTKFEFFISLKTAKVLG
jgi:hypothetical protein